MDVPLADPIAADAGQRELKLFPPPGLIGVPVALARARAETRVGREL